MNNDFRKDKPGPEGELEFNLPKAKKFKLKNGIKVSYIEKEDLPIIKVNIVVNSGSKNDPEGKKGLTYLTSMVIDEGAGKYDALELDAEFEKLGTALAILTSQDYVNLSSLSLTENFELSLNLISQIILKPHFNVDNYEIEKMKLNNKLKRKMDDPEYVASNVFEKNIFADNYYAYPAMGLPQDIDSITLDDLKACYAVSFVTGNIDILAAGSIPAEKLEELLNNYLGDVKKGDRTEDSEIEAKPVKSRITFVSKPDSAQSEIRIGHPGGKRKDSEYYSKLLLNSVLGGQFSSRLTHNLREVKGYTYGIHSSFNYYKDAGYFEINTSVQKEVTVDAVKEIIKEIDGIFDGVKPEELTFCKSYMILRYPSLFETYSQLVNHLTSLNLHGLDDNYFNEYLGEIKKVELENVHEALKHISKENFEIVIVGDDSILEDMKKEFDLPVEVINYKEAL